MGVDTHVHRTEGDGHGCRYLPPWDRVRCPSAGASARPRGSAPVARGGRLGQGPPLSVTSPMSPRDAHRSPPARSLLPLVAIALSVGCGGPLPGSEPRSAEGASLSADGGVSADAAVVAFAPVHSMTVTACASDPDACRSAGMEVTRAVYLVAFGAGAGTLRSRDQASADIYRELRDRTGFGTKLMAVPHRIVPRSDARAIAPGAAPTARPTSSTPDPLIVASFDLLETVDAEGQITLDVMRGRTTCKVSLASSSAPRDGGVDGGGSRRCLVNGPDGPERLDEPTPRDREKRFGS